MILILASNLVWPIMYFQFLHILGSFSTSVSRYKVTLRGTPAKSKICETRGKDGMAPAEVEGVI